MNIPLWIQPKLRWQQICGHRCFSSRKFDGGGGGGGEDDDNNFWSWTRTTITPNESTTMDSRWRPPEISQIIISILLLSLILCQPTTFVYSAASSSSSNHHHHHFHHNFHRINNANDLHPAKAHHHPSLANPTNHLVVPDARPSHKRRDTTAAAATQTATVAIANNNNNSKVQVGSNNHTAAAAVIGLETNLAGVASAHVASSSSSLSVATASGNHQNDETQQPPPPPAAATGVTAAAAVALAAAPPASSSLTMAHTQSLKSYTTSNKSINFTHIELDTITGNIYVGASNWIFQLDSITLRVEHAVRTGPIRDSPVCPPSDCSGVDSQSIQVTNNINKVLLVEPYARMLIVCGSVHQGACTRHRLEDISQHEDLIPIPVAANDENSSTVAFVGPARYFGVQLTPILYVAATDTRLGPYRDMVPAIAGRSLESSRLFQIIDRGFADSARVDISSNLRDYFTVHYVYGFYANDYVYFAQVQRRSYLRTLEEMGYTSRLSRVCVSDAGFHTYTELTLECVYEASGASGGGGLRDGPGGRFRARYHGNNDDDDDDGRHQSDSKITEHFNLLQDAIVIKAGADLSDSLNIERGSLVLIGVFSNSFDHTNRPGDKSALCVYPINDIEQRFAENIHLCYNGSVFSRNMDYIAGSVNQCPEPGAGNVYNFCNEAVKLNGSIPLRSQASIVYRSGTVLTAVAAGVTGQHTVAFIGTDYGSIKKILLSRGDYGQQFDEVSIDLNNPILADLFVDNDQNPKYLIASSPYKVVKFPVEFCVQHKSCDQCLQARNPYCGWCSLQKRCTIKSDCLLHYSSSSTTSISATGGAGPDGPTNGGVDSSGVYHYPNQNPQHHHYHHHHHGGAPPSTSPSISPLFSTPRWLSLETSQCIDFQAIKPEYIPRNLLAPVELIINQLPPLPYGANYLCVFENGTPIPATVTRNGLACQTPNISSRPAIPLGQDHINVNVAVRSSETDTDFIHRSFIFFDCSVHKSCKSCVMSAWDCNWCMHENLCTYNTSLCTRRVIVGENSPQNSLIKGVQHCPSFNIDQEILIPNGSRRELSVEVRNLIPSQDGFQCIVEIEQAKERVSARVQDNNIICNDMMLSYQDEIGQQRASLTVLWNSDTFIDRTNFTIYKCEFLGAYAGRADCSLCQTRDTKYGCVWCQNQCQFVDHCQQMPVNTCPPPRIDYIHPISGPVEGGTLVSIEGSNLGSSLDEIKDRVSIGGIPCQPTQYNISIRVICRTGPSIIGPQSALVVIGNRAGVTRAQEKFQYKIIELTDVNPKIGPQSGGTRIYLSGKNLNIGSNVAVYLDDLPCFVERALASSFQMSCRTSPAPYSSYVVNRLILMVDGANFTLINPFLYTPDPTIERIEPLQSFFSGGRIITITGTQFTSIQQPRMLVFVPRSPLHHHLPVHHHQRPAPNNHNQNNNNNNHHHHYHHYSSTWPSAYSLKQSNNGGNPTTTMMMMTMMMMDGLPSPTTTTTTMSTTYNGFRIDQNRLINESICTVLSPIKMQCHSPMINGDLQLLASMLGQANNNNNLDQQQQQQQSPQPQPMAANNNNNNNSTLHHIPNQIYLQIGFIMDGTLSTLELDQYYPHLDSTMLYVSDPIIYSLNNGHGKSIVVGRHNAEDSVLPFKGDVLVIEGENLAVLLLSENELNVTVGTKRCNLTSVTMRQIICQPPVYPPPPPTDELGRRGPIDLPSVVLKIGNMRKHLGYLHYGDYFYGYNPMDPYAAGPNGAGGGGGVGDDSSRFYHHNPAFGYGGAQGNGGGGAGGGGNRFEPVTTINVELLIVVSIVIGTILTIISVIILAAYKHKTTQAEREYKRIQLQMDTLENNVRSECKQAFAELQTDILQANGLFNMDDLPRISLPTHDERTFLLRMFVSTGMLSNQNNNNTPGYLEDNGGGVNNGQLQPLQHSLKSQNLYQMFWFWSPYFTINDDNDNDKLPPTTTTTNHHHQTPPIIHLNPMFKDLHHHNNNNNNYPENFYTLNQRQPLQYGPMASVGVGGGFPDENVILTAGQRPSIVIEQFEQLILNRTFLLILVDTLEQQQKTFQYADRMRFASLLMLTLLDRMEYSFDVMRHLLSRLLDRFAAMKNSNQLIRKQETIVEKIMIDWLTICLHKYAKEISSGPLFLLFSAIKHQIDKGPVDYVTGNSRYSLSEDKLLREQIDYKTLTVHVFLDEKLQQIQCKTERFSPTTTNAANNNNTANTTNAGGNAAPLAACNQTTQIRNRRRVSTLRNNTRTLLNKKQQPQSQPQPQTMLDTNHNEAVAANNNNNNYEVGGGGGATPEDVAGGSGGSSGGFTSVTGFGGDTQTTSSTDITDKDDDQPTGIIGGGGGGGNGTAESHGTTTTTTTTTTTSSPNSGYPCRVLDCDTITQVKMKIIDQLYRCVPNAERPQVQELQLYWRCVRPKSNSLNPLAQAIKNHNNNSNNNNNNNNNNMADYNGTEASFNSDHSSSTPNHHHHHIGSGSKHNSVSTTTAFGGGGGGGAIQDVYGVASLMSKSDADKIYNASRRSDVSLEMADILLDDYDHSTQILTANEAIWRRLNTISHYGITDGAMFYLCSRPSNTKSSSSCYGDQNSLIYGANNNNGGAKRLNHSIHSGGGAGGSYSGVGGGGGPTTTIQNRTKPNDLSPSIRVPNDFINHAQSRYPYVASVGGGSGILNTNNANNNDEMYGGDNDADNTEFHLYESIPADRQQQQQPPSMGVSDMSMGVGMGGGYTSRDSFYGSTAAMMMATMNGGTNVDSVYNLSNASSSAVRSRSQYPVAAGNYAHHHQQQRSLLLHQYEPFNYGRTTTTTTTISSPQQRSAMMMAGGGEDVLYPCSPSIQNQNNNGNFPGTTRIYFGNNSFQASSPPTSLSSPPYQSSTPMLANGHVVGGGGQQRFLLNPVTSNNHHHRNNNNRLNSLNRHRSFARNVYDRLSMFMRGRTKQQPRPYHHYNGQKRFRNTTNNNNHKKNGNRNPFNDYAIGSDDMATAMIMATNENDHHQQQPPEERHNIWHLVKPSSLIADCIIGASGGSFLYDNGDDGKRGPRYNLRTMRQRRALRRRRNKPSLAGFSHNHFNHHNNNGKLYNTTNTSATQLAAVASAALSASQMNLNQVGVLAGFGSGSVSMNSLAMAANNYHHHNNNNGNNNNNNNNNNTIYTHHGSSRMMGGAGGGSTGGAGGSSSPLSLLTTSASTLFSNIFKTNGNNNNNNNNNNIQDNNNSHTIQDTTGSNSSQQHALMMNSSISAYLMNRSIPEIYLTRLLTTKGTIQQYVEDFFRTIFTVNERLPIAIKWLFDFFDQETMKNSIQYNTGNTGNNDTNNSANNETVLLWKSHSLIMRFWVTLLRMPEILFDVNSNVSIDVCLDVLAQNLVETCQKCLPDSGLNGGGGGAAQPKLSKDSPASKLLCARDIANYQQMIEQYYKDIQRLPAIKEGDIIAYMKDVSKTFEGKICKEKCLDQILGYCLQYKEAIFQSLAQDPQAQQEHLRMRFETIIYAAMATTSTTTAHTTVVQPPPSAQHHQPTNIIDNPYGRGPQQPPQQQQQQYYPTSMMINTMINGSENGITRV